MRNWTNPWQPTYKYRMGMSIRRIINNYSFAESIHDVLFIPGTRLIESRRCARSLLVVVFLPLDEPAW
jgi:hypothetical protein